MNDIVEVAVYRGVGITRQHGYIVATMCNFIGGGVDEVADIAAAKGAIDNWVYKHSGSSFK